MRLRNYALIAGAVLAFAAPRLEAQSVLWFVDSSNDGSTAAGMSALGTALPSATITGASSVSDFFIQLAGGSWDLAVLGEQGNFIVGSGDATVMANYLAGGGRVLGMTWTPDPFAGVMDAAFVDSNGDTITDNGSPYYASIWGSSPITIHNSGWGVFSQSYSALDGAACVGSLGAGCAAVLGNGNRSLLLGPLDDSYDGSFGADLVLNSSLFLLDQEPPTTVPEPMTMTLLATGMAGIAAAKRRRRS